MNLIWRTSVAWGLGVGEGWGAIKAQTCATNIQFHFSAASYPPPLPPRSHPFQVSRPLRLPFLFFPFPSTCSLAVSGITASKQASKHTHIRTQSVATVCTWARTILQQLGDCLMVQSLSVDRIFWFTHTRAPYTLSLSLSLTHTHTQHYTHSLTLSVTYTSHMSASTHTQPEEVCTITTHWKAVKGGCRSTPSHTHPAVQVAVRPGLSSLVHL